MGPVLVGCFPPSPSVYPLSAFRPFSPGLRPTQRGEAEGSYVGTDQGGERTVMTMAPCPVARSVMADARDLLRLFGSPRRAIHDLCRAAGGFPA